MKLINNPIVKIIGIIFIIYFALFHDKENQNSLRNRLAPERIKKNVTYITNQASNARNDINLARKEQAKKKNLKITCGDVIKVDIKKEYKDDVSIKTNTVYIIDSSELSKNIINMSVGASKEFTIEEKSKEKIKIIQYNVRILKILEKNNEECN